MRKNKIENIQALRGVAALLVFAAHLKGAELDYGGGGELLPFALNMGVAGVDLFFLISGYVMVHVSAVLKPGAKAGGRFMFNRAARVYPLYWFVTALILILYAGKKYFFGEDTPITNAFASMFLLPDENFPILPVGWTLVHEIYFYAVFSVFILFPRRALPVLITGWAAIVAAGDMLGWRSVNAWTALILSPMTFEFIAGCTIAFIVRRGAARYGAPTLAAGIVWFAIISLPFAHQLYPGAFEDHLLRTIFFLPPFALMLYGAVALETTQGKMAPVWLRRAGDASYSLYLIHMPAVLVVGKIFSLIAGEGVADNAALIILAGAIGLAAAFAVHEWAEKPGLKATRWIGDQLINAPVQKTVEQNRAW